MAQSSSADERAEAARELKVFLRNDTASAILVDLLGDSDWRVRRAAVESFLEMRAQNAIPLILLSLYDEENAGKRNAAIDILSRYGKEVVPYLEPHLKTENPDVQMFLINILGDMRDDTYLDYITRSLDNPNANIVSAAILAIGKIGHPESLPSLVRFLNSKDVWLTFQAIEATGEMQDPATIDELIQLYDCSYYRKPVIKALSKFHHRAATRALTIFLVSGGIFNQDAFKALIEQYHDPAPTELKSEEQRITREELRNVLTAEAIEVLLRGFHDCRPEIRRHMLEILGWAKARPAIRLMIESLEDPELAETAAGALIQCDREALGPLLEHLHASQTDDQALIALTVLNELSTVPELAQFENFLQHESADIRFQAYRLLTRCPNQESAELLIRGIMDPHSPIAEVCREPLLERARNSKMKRSEVIEKVHPLMHSQEPVERANALEFLTLLQGEESFPLLFQALKDPEAAVRQKAVHLMGTGYHHEFQRQLTAALADEDPRVREMAARALSSYSSPDVVAALQSSIRDEVIWVRMATYESLSILGDEAATPALIEQLSTETPIAVAVILKGLGQFRRPACKELLLKYLNSDDPEIRKSACESLGVFNDNDIVFRLFTLLQNDTDWGVRVAAVRALTNIRPFRLQEALLERLRADEDPFVRKEILTSLQKLGVDHVPQEVYAFLLDQNLADTTYDFLVSVRFRFSKQIQEAMRFQSPAIRRILKTIVS